MTQTLFNFTFSHGEAVLLAAIPALLNIAIFIYLRTRTPDYKISRLFALFQLALALWQINDILVRMSSTVEAAEEWNAILSVGWLFTTSIGLHFTLHYTGRKAFAESLAFQFLIYFPAVVFVILNLTIQNKNFLAASEFWGWKTQASAWNMINLESYWISVQAMLMLFLLFHYAFRKSKGTAERKQAMLIAIGFAFPVTQGVITEIILPIFDPTLTIPLTTTFMTGFSIATLIALIRYKLFNVTESLKIPTILNALTNILIIISPDGIIRFISNQGAKTLGINPSLAVGTKISQLFISKEDTQKFMDQLILPTLNNERIMNYPAELMARGTGKINTVISATSFKEKPNEAQILLLIQDISGQVQTQNQLAEREQELKDKSEELNMFFYRATHDMKGPSASITGLIRLAQKEGFPAEVMTYISKIGTSAARLENILFDFIRLIHNRERQISPVRIDFDEMADEIIQPLKLSETSTHFHVLADWPEGFMSDNGLVTSIMYNLVVNASKYRKKQSEEESFVNVQIKPFENGIKIRVSDNGQGIAPEIQNDIFNIFFRGGENAQGTGLGLYIVKNAVTKLKGRISLESKIGVGTTFTVYLPDMRKEYEQVQLDETRTIREEKHNMPFSLIA